MVSGWTHPDRAIRRSVGRSVDACCGRLNKRTTPDFIGAFGQLLRSQKVSLLPSSPSMRVWSAARSIAGSSAILLGPLRNLWVAAGLISAVSAVEDSGWLPVHTGGVGRWAAVMPVTSGSVPARSTVSGLVRPDRAWHRARRRQGRCAPLRDGLAAILDRGYARCLGDDQAGTEKRSLAAEQRNMTACPSLPPPRPTRGRCDPRQTAGQPASSVMTVAGLRLRQKEEQLAAGRVERALLDFGLAMRKQRSAIVADEIENDLLDRCLP
jgi:hypothetical protein